LLKSNTDLHTDQLTTALGIEPKSLPPVLRSLKRWCEHQKLNFSGLIETKPIYANKRYLTSYHLTDQGRLTFAGRVGTGTVLTNDGKDSTMSTA
jgi:hypothetical protein